MRSRAGPGLGFQARVAARGWWFTTSSESRALAERDEWRVENKYSRVLTRRAVVRFRARGHDARRRRRDDSELVPNVADDAVDVEFRSVASNDATGIVDEKFDKVPLERCAGFARDLLEDWIFERGERLEEHVQDLGEVAAQIFLATLLSSEIVRGEPEK